MAKAPEVRRLPRQVDVAKLCAQSLVLEGQVALAELPRLMEVLLESPKEAMLKPQLRFRVDDEGHRVMDGQFAITLPVICQRCLEPMEHPVRADFHCALVMTDEQAKGLPSHLEPVMVDGETGQLALYELLEDELLLSLPIAAFHEHCDKKLQGSGEARQKPFAGLAALLDGKSLEKERK